MRDRTQPVPAPPGLKWTITRSVVTNTLYELQLWPEGVSVDEHGMGWSPPLKKRTDNFAKGCTFPRSPFAYEFVRHERQIYRLSKRALKRGLRHWARERQADEFVKARRGG